MLIMKLLNTTKMKDLILQPIVCVNGCNKI